MSSELIILANSHGEIEALVRPFVAAFHKVQPETRITLVIPPCQYASGKEVDIARTFTEISRVIPPRESMRWIWRNHSPENFSRAERGAVLYMGGDTLYPLLLAKRLGYVPLAYFNHHARRANQYKKGFLPNASLASMYSKKGGNAKSYEVVGDIMVDSMDSVPDKKDARASLNLATNQTVITFLPGSHAFQIRHLTPLFLKTAGMIRQKIPHAQLVFCLSPFTSLSDFKKFVIPTKTSGGASAYGAFVQKEGRPVLRTQHATIHLTHDHHNAFAASDVCVTSPGTNTAQIAAVGTPMVVAFPLEHPEDIPLEGIAHYVTKVPILGRWIRQRILKGVLSRTQYFALPNMRSQTEVVPEIVGKVTAEMIAQKIWELTNEKGRLEEISRQLRKVMGSPGAAERMSQEIAATLVGDAV